jgi:23S rRNA (uracil1939-C5)-methyltransferase
MAHRGLGIARVDGRVVFVFGALPGEEVTARITKVRRQHAFADTLEVHRVSVDRVEPPCPYFGSCGGCQLQHLSYQAQLKTKLKVLVEAVSRQGLRVPDGVELVGSAEEWRYRWRGEFHVSQEGPALGFTRRSDYRILGVSDCLIHHPSIGLLLRAVGEVAGSQGAGVKTVQVTVGEEGRQLLLDARPGRQDSGAIAARVATGLEPALTVTDEATGIRYRDRGFRVFPDSFIQVNQGSLEHLYEGVVAWLGPELPGTHVVDAYGGLGILSLRLADLGARVTVLESNPVSARLCQLHAEMYAPSQVQVVCGPVEIELPQAEPASAVVLDPPRAGLGPEVRGWLSLAGPATLVYLSCEVSALARDLNTLCRLGPYQLERLRLVDMFPQTYHFETVALLRRR